MKSGISRVVKTQLDRGSKQAAVYLGIYRSLRNARRAGASYALAKSHYIAVCDDITRIDEFNFAFLDASEASVALNVAAVTVSAYKAKYPKLYRAALKSLVNCQRSSSRIPTSDFMQGSGFEYRLCLSFTDWANSEEGIGC